MGSQRVRHDWVTELNWTAWEEVEDRRACRLWFTGTSSEGEKRRRHKPLVCPSTWGRTVRAPHLKSPIKGVPCLWSRGFSAHPTMDRTWQHLGASVSYPPHSHRPARCMLRAFTTCQTGLCSNTWSQVCTLGADLNLSSTLFNVQGPDSTSLLTAYHVSIPSWNFSGNSCMFLKSKFKNNRVETLRK